MRKKYTFKWTGFGKYERIETEIKEPRKNGFYWVKYKGGEAWTIAEWYGDHWVALRDTETLNDNDFEMIHEEPIEQPMY